ncbi:DUF6464 family protein [Allocoleopsis sp.]|uniref:DUF6464 family protein n=1 Tax=Allocoleopsis sp. TaxID=3088169 RepID=UPI002FD39CFC
MIDESRKAYLKRLTQDVLNQLQGKSLSEYLTQVDASDEATEFQFQECKPSVDAGVGTSCSALMEWTNRQIREILDATALPPNFLQGSSRDHYREAQQQQHHWMALIMDIQLVVNVRQEDAISTARELRDRYPNMSLTEIRESIRAGALRQTPSGRYFISPLWLERNYLRGSMHQAESVADVLNRLATGEKLEAIGDRACKNNAQSPYLRCAVNPCGPCEECSYFEEEVRDHDE